MVRFSVPAQAGGLRGLRMIAFTPAPTAATAPAIGGRDGDGESVMLAWWAGRNACRIRWNAWRAWMGATRPCRRRPPATRYGLWEHAPELGLKKRPMRQCAPGA